MLWEKVFICHKRSLYHDQKNTSQHPESYPSHATARPWRLADPGNIFSVSILRMYQASSPRMELTTSSGRPNVCKNKEFYVPSRRGNQWKKGAQLRQSNLKTYNLTPGSEAQSWPKSWENRRAP